YRSIATSMRRVDRFDHRDGPPRPPLRLGSGWHVASPSAVACAMIGDTRCWRPVSVGARRYPQGMTVTYSARAGGETRRPVPRPDVIARARAAVRGPYLAILLYGSQARGTQRPDSDIDVLQVVRARPGKYSDGNVNVTAYTIDTLWEMCQQGSLF